jgi:hypothetical protein
MYRGRLSLLAKRVRRIFTRERLKPGAGALVVEAVLGFAVAFGLGLGVAVEGVGEGDGEGDVGARLGVDAGRAARSLFPEHDASAKASTSAITRERCCIKQSCTR